MLTELNGLIGLTKYYEQEKYILKKLQQIQESHSYVQNISSDAISETQTQIGFDFTDEQVQAIQNSIENNVTFITGGPGVGKTLIIRGLVNVFNNYGVMLMSLSAKAAQRMFELTSYKAYTIHKSLGFTSKGFKCNSEHPIPADVIIVDEFSMVNVPISKALIEAVNLGCKIIFVGDKDQLPPIGAGNVFSDLLKKKFPVSYLTKIHRQDAKSGIIVDSSIIKTNINPVKMYSNQWITKGELNDLHYYFTDNTQNIQNVLVKSFLKGVEDFGIDEVVLMVPMKERGLNATRILNMIIQDHLIGNDVKFITRAGTKFKLGCKVIQRENDYHGKEVINGEIGYICDIFENEFVVNFKDRMVTYSHYEIKEIEQAYALTVHSAQGSQFKMAITGLDMSHYVLLSNQLLYTAMTRASVRSVIVAQPKAFTIAVKQNLNERETYLKYL